MPDVVLSVDPGTRQGWSTYKGKDLVDHGAFEIRRRANRLDRIVVILRKAAKLCEDGSELVLAIEDQYQGVNPQTLKSLVESRMEWETAAALSEDDWDIVRVNPRSWQSSVLGSNSRGKQMPREQAKKKARMFVESVFKKKKLSEDTIDAICIGRYHTVTRDMEARMAEARR